jgi:eukaryotic-like serine/threonine-protein kinase
MGVVVAAHHLQLDDEVAIKFMLPSALADTYAVDRFLREARAAVKIKGEHVVRVMDVGSLENGAPYMVMEFLKGKDLGEYLLEKGSLSVEQAVEFLLQVADAVADAHSLGIVHRDLKPANLFVLPRPNGTHLMKVLDFGISKVLDAGLQSGMTHTSTIMGSPFYMSPEQLRSTRDVDTRSDIWALGVILYEVLAGGTPFQGDTMPELIHRTIYEPPPPLRDARPDVPVELEQVIAKCLEKDPSLRFQSVGEFAGALVAFAPSRSKAPAERISGFARPSAAAVTMMSVDSAHATDSRASSAKSVRDETVRSWTHPEPKGTKKKAASIVVGTLLLIAAAWVAIRGVRAPEAERATPPEPSNALPAAPAPPEASPELRTVAERPSPAVVPETAPSSDPGVLGGAPVPPQEPNKSTPVRSSSRSKPAKAERPATSAAAPTPPASQPAPAPIKPSIDSLIDGRK